MTHTIITIHPDGMITSLYDKPKLAILQGEVGGYIQQIPWFTSFQKKRVTAYVDEEGWFKKLKPNPTASALSDQAYKAKWQGAAAGVDTRLQTQICGPLVLVVRGMFALNKEDLPK